MRDGIDNPPPARWAGSELPTRAPLPSFPEPEREPRFQPGNRNQLMWRPVEGEKLGEPDPWVRAIWELAGQLDRKRYSADVGSVKGVAGRPPFDPRLLLSLWVYAYSQKVSSAREVERRGSYHPA